VKTEKVYKHGINPPKLVVECYKRHRTNPPKNLRASSNSLLGEPKVILMTWNWFWYIWRFSIRIEVL